ncbi:uncharacterized protein LOC106662388 [Cimex lectularius]|uniref:Uncharacterized protein n=1 Tax=Cimex lectularius TaxID=79782 RepID=A0A8I6RA98_CIMLE|nr:uncharacterized protein LOC106662388 [Cimex lectularius]
MRRKIIIKACHPTKTEKNSRPMIIGEKCRCKNCPVHAKRIPKKISFRIVRDTIVPEPPTHPYKDWVPDACCCKGTGGCYGKKPEAETKEKAKHETDDDSSDFESDSSEDDDGLFPFNVISKTEYNNWIASLNSANGVLCQWPKYCQASCFDHPQSLRGIKPLDHSYKPPMAVLDQDPLVKKKVKRECRPC